MIDDFAIETTDKSIHVLNAPSPGATSSLVIGNYIAGLALEKISLD
jgi:L-2-hydroxyglutarate oxidase LhgO